MNEHRVLVRLATFLILIAFLHRAGAEQQIILSDDFSKGLNKAWKIKRLYKRENTFTVMREGKNHVLKVKSNSSASGLVRKWRVDALKSGNISWNWKVDRSLSENTVERTKEGDDYAARVFLLFEPHFFSWRTPNVCYVWAGNEPAGSVFKSPHSKSVCTIVLQTGNTKSAQWLRQERDFVADYEICFGKKPEKLSAVAIMADTDNTGEQSTAWFDDLKIVATTR